MEMIIQFMILFSGIISSFLIAKKNKWAYIFLLLGDPFWILTGIKNHQWGIIASSSMYMCMHIYGFYNWWIKKEDD